MIAIVVIVAALVLGGIAWGLVALLGGEPDPTADPTTSASPTDATSDPTTDPSPDPTTAPPTDDPDPTTTTTDGSVVDLTGSDPAIMLGETGEPIVEVRLLSATPDWQPADDNPLCGDPANGSYLAVELEVTTLAALAQEDPADFTLLGWELGTQVGDVTAESSAFLLSALCLSQEESLPSGIPPGQTASGTVIIDTPPGVTSVLFADPFDFTGNAATYRWVLADQ
ncbi:MAG: hypothetical protein ACK5H2_10820 [Beutenbergiaceae bacterium]